MQFFSRPKGDVVDHYRGSTGRRGKVLAFASGPRIELLAFVDRFAYRFGDQPWQVVGWHQVMTGGWKQESEQMHWRLVDGGRESFQLSDPGAFPQVFRERVNASIALDETFEAPGRGEIEISARRNLDPQATGLVWNVRAVRGASLEDPATADLARRLEASLRADYDF